MLVSYKWLRDYVEVTLDPMDLAERLTMAGLAVEGIHQPGAQIQKVYTGKILAMEPHPNADRLTICKVSVGEEEPLQIVTGATNIQVGNIVPVATEGAHLAGGLVIKKSKLRGIESRGMLCSGQELGLDSKTMPEEQAHGIMILKDDLALGQDIRPLVGLDDTILELELTPNRGDAMSMVGVAREVAALLGLPLHIPDTDPVESGTDLGEKVKIEILDSTLCRRYVAKLFTNVRIGPSPAWMQERLQAAGVRPINNVVDITNYVMLEMGQPLHAFDYDGIQGGHIIVKRAEEGSGFVSLDGVERHLRNDMLVIADARGPLALAGVMGGLDSEVTEKTVNVLLESAWFDPVCVRRTSKTLGLRSESSSRFEKGIDLTGCLRAANRAARLLLDMQGGEVVPGEVDCYPSPYIPKTILARPERVAQALGVTLERELCKKILLDLDFAVQDGLGEEAKHHLLVTVPGHRPDVSLEADIIEEVARLYGYDKIPATLPYGSTTQGKRSQEQKLQIMAKDKMAALGFQEVVNYSFVSEEIFDKIQLPAESVLRKTLPLQNPLSEEQAVMRTVMLPGLLQVLQRNASRKVEHLSIFELGKVYWPQEGQALPEERLMLAAAAMGQTTKGWNKQPLQRDFYYLKGALESLFAQLRIKGWRVQPCQDNPSYHPGRAARILVAKEEIGVLGEIHPDVGENYELPYRAVAMELDFSRVLQLADETISYQKIPRFPGVERDLAVVVDQHIPVQEIMELVKKTGGQLLREVVLFDVYQGEQVEKGCQSLAFSLHFIADDRTLTDGEVSDILGRIQNKLANKFEAKLRSS